MRRGKLWIVTVFFILMCTAFTEAQKSSTKKPVKKTEVKKTPPKKTTQTKTVTKTPAKKAIVKEPAVKEPAPDEVEDQKKVRNIVSVLSYMLNTLGSSESSARDKEVVVSESYSKIFRDSKVQVEDDLVADRLVVTNKDVTAYLKDVDFFFANATFEFTIDNIQGGVNADNKHFYKAAITRNLKGTTTDGQSVNTTIPRFIEISYDPVAQDLKIVSMYTTEYSGKDALANWWKSLSYEWQSVFKKKFSIIDSAKASDIKNMALVEELDISNNQSIVNIDPLSYLTRLKSINISHTNVSDLVPIRNLPELKDLNASYTKVVDIAALKYSGSITKLNLSHTGINDIAVLEKMPGLQWLDLEKTAVSDISSIASLSELTYLNLQGTAVTDIMSLSTLAKLTELNVSQTSVQDLNPLKSLKAITSLDIDSTRVNSIAAVSTLEALKVLHSNFTSVADLQPLQKLTHLEKVYVDQSSVQHTVADAYMVANPKVLIIYDSKDLQSWWTALSPEWQQVFNKASKITTAPTKEDLARLGTIDSLNISGNTRLKNLEPLRKLQKLSVLIADNAGITDIAPLEASAALTYLDISGNEVSDISVAKKFTKLKIFRGDKTKIEDLGPLAKLPSLQKIYVDQTGVQDFTMRDFIKKNDKTLVIYKTIHLNRWWNALSTNWKNALRAQLGNDTTATKENLHKLVELSSLKIKDSQIGDLSALNEFVALKELHMTGSSVTEVPALENLMFLTSLHITNSPLQQLKNIASIKTLEDLDISNTPIDDLKDLGSLENVKTFNCSGTQVKKLDLLSYWSSLESLDCSNSRVTNLDPLLPLPIKSLKCYNTKISERHLANFKKSKPECDVVYYR